MTDIYINIPTRNVKIKTFPFVPHTEYICNDAAKMLGFISKNARSFINTESLKYINHIFLKRQDIYTDVYFSDWYIVTKSSLVQDLQLVIARCQKRGQFSAAGLYKINVVCLVTVIINCYIYVLNASISFLSVLK